MICSPITPPHPWPTLCKFANLANFLTKTCNFYRQKRLATILATFAGVVGDISAVLETDVKARIVLLFLFSNEQPVLLFPTIHRQMDRFPTDKRPRAVPAVERRTTRRACATPLLNPLWLSEQTYVATSRSRNQLNADWLTELANSPYVLNILANQVIRGNSLLPHYSHRIYRWVLTAGLEFVSSGVLAMNESFLFVTII